MDLYQQYNRKICWLLVLLTFIHSFDDVRPCLWNRSAYACDPLLNLMSVLAFSFHLVQNWFKLELLPFSQIYLVLFLLCLVKTIILCTSLLVQFAGSMYIYKIITLRF
jgi:hypothetical protein